MNVADAAPARMSSDPFRGHGYNFCTPHTKTLPAVEPRPLCPACGKTRLSRYQLSVGVCMACEDRATRVEWDSRLASAHTPRDLDLSEMSLPQIFEAVTSKELGEACGKGHSWGHEIKCRRRQLTPAQEMSLRAALVGRQAEHHRIPEWYESEATPMSPDTTLPGFWADLVGRFLDGDGYAAWIDHSMVGKHIQTCLVKTIRRQGLVAQVSAPMRDGRVYLVKKQSRKAER